MNNVSLMGRLAREVSTRTIATQNGEVTTASFTVAVNRRRRDEADFISCQAWGKTAELIAQNFRKGDRICLSGRIQTGSYTNREGATVYTTDVVVEGFDFVEPKRKDGDFVPAESGEGLPF